MTANAFTPATGTENTAAASTTIAGTVIMTAIIIANRQGIVAYYDIIPSNWAAFPPRMARRSASLNPGVLRTWSTVVVLQGYG
jgi:hypothetical protein